MSGPPVPGSGPSAGAPVDGVPVDGGPVDGGLSRDTLLGGRVTLWQPRRGYRAAIDPVLLAAAASASAGEAVADLGCGVGAVFLCLAARVPGLTVVGVEVDADLAALARRNVLEMQARPSVDLTAEIITADVFGRPAPLPGNRFDLVLCNPPFHDPVGAQPSPDGGRDRANRSREPLAAWLGEARRSLRPRGRLAMILRADRVVEALAGLTGFGAVEILPLWSQPNTPAKRVILRAVKGAKTPPALLPGHVLHTAEGGFTDAARAILEDAAGFHAAGLHATGLHAAGVDAATPGAGTPNARHRDAVTANRVGPEDGTPTRS